MKHNKNSHCCYCGDLFVNQTSWPRKCIKCNNESYTNPIPVVVVLISIRDESPDSVVRYGLLIQKRAIEPKKGEWALTGGYIDDGETWQAAAVREVREELGIETKEDHYELYSVTSSTNKNNILIFCTLKHSIQGFDPIHFVINSEVDGVAAMWDEMELAFPAHTEHANKYLAFLKQH
jgi:ADP-ribose pyrophosphatase YjhB (NUDIX family)